jgi:3'5'-cyclic nucleotide phosphodiesterase
MVNTSTEAATTWNDISVNENMHAATAFRLLRQPANSFLAGLDADDYRFVRRTVIGIVLATDMASHAELVADFSGEEVRHRMTVVEA